MSCKVLVICPDWEILYDKCKIITNKLMDKVDTSLITDMTLNLLKYINVNEGLVILPQICILKNNTRTRILTREEIATIDTDKLIEDILKFCYNNTDKHT